MAGARNDILFGGGLDLSGNSTVANRLDTDGFIYFGSGSTNPVAALPTSVNDTVTFHPSAGGLGFENRRWLTAFVVDPSADVGERGTYQTITEANAAASSGDMVYIRSGTYTEDWTAKAGISYVGDTDKNATTLLTGKVTLSETGVCFFKNLAFASNADNVILHSGANDVEGYFENCYFETDDAVAIISSTNTNSSSVLEFKTCNFLVNNSTATYVAHSGTAELRFFYCEMRSNGTWAVNNLLSSSTGGFSIFHWCYIQGSFTTSNNHEFRFHFTELNPQTNTVILTHNSTAGSRDKEVYHCIMRASTTTSTAISIGASATLDLVSTTIDSQNATTISGTGTLRYADLVFTNTDVIDAGLTLVPWATRTGDITLNAGATINEFSTDGTLAGDSDTAVPTEKAVKTYVDSQSGGGGAWELISSATASNSATIDFTGLSATYFMYMVVINNLRPANDANPFCMRTSSNNGSSYDSGASDYGWSIFIKSFDLNSGSGIGDAADALIRLTDGNGSAANEIASCIVYIQNPSAAIYTQVSAECISTSAAGIRFRTIAGGSRLSAADVDAIRFLYSTGNIASGEFKLYGLKAS